MPDKTLLSALEQFGLSKKEAAVYYAALRLGPCSVLSLAKESGVPRTTIYSLIDSLERKQLLHREVRGIKDCYVAENPERLKGIFQARLDALSNALPQLTAMYRAEGGESVVRFYQGYESLKSVYLELLKRVKINEDYLVLGDMHSWINLDPDFTKRFVEARAKLDIKVRMIMTPSEAARKRQGPLRKANERTRLLPPGTILTTNLVIISAMVFIHETTAPITGMVIENAHINRMHREMYEIMWHALTD